MGMYNEKYYVNRKCKCRKKRKTVGKDGEKNQLIQ